ncbi:LexA family protein [Ochrobactrum sp. EDr1-4]|uniref:LexA family protein n=1 Tax=Ochrobactrum sp. EDr1-4 TaxID=3368622 RepID=UPI003B9E0381
MNPITPKQKEAFDFIREFMAKNEYAPSYIEIMEALGLQSKSGVHRLLHSLQERGLIKLRPNRSRAIEIPKGEAAEFHLRRVLRALEDLPVSTHPSVLHATRFLAGAA